MKKIIGLLSAVVLLIPVVVCAQESKTEMSLFGAMLSDGTAQQPGVPAPQAPPLQVPAVDGWSDDSVVINLATESVVGGKLVTLRNVLTGSAFAPFVKPVGGCDLSFEGVDSAANPVSICFYAGAFAGTPAPASYAKSLSPPLKCHFLMSGDYTLPGSSGIAQIELKGTLNLGTFIYNLNGKVGAGTIGEVETGTVALQLVPNFLGQAFPGSWSGFWYSTPAKDSDWLSVTAAQNGSVITGTISIQTHEVVGLISNYPFSGTVKGSNTHIVVDYPYGGYSYRLTVNGWLDTDLNQISGSYSVRGYGYNDYGTFYIAK